MSGFQNSGAQIPKVYSEAYMGGLTLQKRKKLGMLICQQLASWGKLCILSLLFHKLPYFGAEFSNKNINEKNTIIQIN